MSEALEGAVAAVFSGRDPGTGYLCSVGNGRPLEISGFALNISLNFLQNGERPST